MTDLHRDNAPIESPVEVNESQLPSGQETELEQVESHGAKPSLARPEDDLDKLVGEVTHSEIGITTLLNRLKQSISSARDFSSFLKERSSLEEKHAQGLKKLCRITYETTRRPDNRQGSYSHHFDEITRIHERMADNGANFALKLHQMYEDLTELAANVERGRKQWKQTSGSSEKRAQDSEALMDKAKAKYDALAEDYDRAKTGDRASSKVFGLKGVKSAAQHEEDLLRKVQAAESDYASKVQTANGHRQELLHAQRPQAVKAVQDLIFECDSALTLQLQKFASFNEKLLLSNGICVSPLNREAEGQNPQSTSLRDAVSGIDNERDFKDYILSFASKAPSKAAEHTYTRHPTLNPQQQQVPSSNRQSQHFGSIGPPGPPGTTRQPGIQLQSTSTIGPQTTLLGSPQHMQGPPQGMQDPGYVPSSPAGQPPGEKGHSYQGGAPAPNQFPPSNLNGPQNMAPSHFPVNLPPIQNSSPVNGSPRFSELPPLKPVYGISLDNLFKRDGTAVPLPVSQCLQAVDLYGLEVEGIYRLSGTQTHISRIKAMFDNDASRVDFRNPEQFFHDVNSVAGALKQFFRELPDPLLTIEHYKEFIDAGRIEDDVVRRDTLHATINSLPDPNYATLRALALHLNRVQEKSEINRMVAGNLATIFGPTLMGLNMGGNIADASWQVRVVSTILQNTYQIFDED